MDVVRNEGIEEGCETMETMEEKADITPMASSSHINAHLEKETEETVMIVEAEEAKVEDNNKEAATARRTLADQRIDSGFMGGCGATNMDNNVSSTIITSNTTTTTIKKGSVVIDIPECGGSDAVVVAVQETVQEVKKRGQWQIIKRRICVE